MQTSMKIVPTTKISQEQWLEERRKGIGGSDAPVVAGVSPYKSRLQLYMEKIGEVPIENIENRFTEWGKRLEPIIADAFKEKTGLKIQRVNFILAHKEYPFMIANIDRKIVGVPEGLEIKTTSAWNVGRFRDDIPDDYYIQCLHYLAVTGWDKWHLAVLIGGNDFRHFVIERDEEAINNLIEIEKDFWLNHVEKRIIPEPDHRDSKILASLYPESDANKIVEFENEEHAKSLVEEYFEYAELEKHYKAKKEEIANKIKALMGEAEIGIVNEYKIIWRTITQSRFDTKTFQKEHPEIYSKYLKQTTYRRFLIK